ncbi:hypothetical protein WJX74_004941 [Apatococcus lobatus]|uniref:FMR1-interacting protein 1 conserved domain-containing protein n=1 Tax=Apatococcus lobatus TaxID=904363 RepID=A0AAW1RV42_9CHLO
MRGRGGRGRGPRPAYQPGMQQAPAFNAWGMDQPGGPTPMVNPGMMGVLPMLPGFGAPPVQQPPGPMPPGRAPSRGRMQPRGGRQGRGGRGGRGPPGPQAMMQQATSPPWPALAPASLGFAPLPVLGGPDWGTGLGGTLPQVQMEGMGPPLGGLLQPMMGDPMGGPLGNPTAGPGRGGFLSRGRSGGRGMMGRGGRAPPAQPMQVQAAGANGAGALPGMTKAQRKEAKAFKKLEAEEHKPARPYRPLSAAEQTEAARWREERKKQYPSAATLEQKAAEQAARAARGELDPAAETGRMRLREVLQRQAAMGLARKAGTEEMLVELAIEGGPGGGFRGQGRRGRGRFDPGMRGRGRFPGGGRGRGRFPAQGPGGLQDSQHKRPLDNGNSPAVAKKPKTDEGLSALLGYGSDGDSDGGGPSEPAAVPSAAQDAVPAAVPAAANGTQPGAVLAAATQPAGASSAVGGATTIEEQPCAVSIAAAGAGRGRGAGAGRGGRGGRGQRGRGRGRGRNARPAPRLPPRAPTLLQKLLAKDIRKDHSYLLQAFRFLVSNDFLQHEASRPLVFPNVETVARTPAAGSKDDMALDTDSDIETAEAASQAGLGAFSATVAGGQGMEADSESEDDDSGEEEEDAGVDSDLPDKADALPGYQDPEMQRNPELLPPGDLAPVTASRPAAVT